MSVKEDGQYMFDITEYETPGNSFSKSNVLINSKYKATLFEQKLLNIMLSRLQMREYVDAGEQEGLVCSVTAKELKDLMNAKSGSFYTQLKTTAESMTSRTIGFENDELQQFKYISLITMAEYRDGIFSVHFNYELKQYLKPTTQFTMLELPVLLQYRGVYSLRLHEVLLSRCYRKKKAGVAKYTSKETDGKHFHFAIGLSELKLAIGVVNAESSAVQRILKGSSNPDYDKAVERAVEKSFNNWNDFKKRVLDPAIKEINKTENGMNVKYELKRAGLGGKVHAIDFFIEFGENGHEEALKAIELEVQAFISPLLPLNDIRAICEAAEYDANKIRQAYAVASSSTAPIQNLAGFLIKAVKDGYNLPVKKETTNKFHNFEQREYDFNELERLLLDKSYEVIKEEPNE